jgi:thymidylate kinase
MAGTATSLFRRVVVRLNEARVTYCVLRDCEALEAFDRGGEVDLLVGKGDISRLEAILEPFGFVRLRAWGHSPHRFFVAYDADEDVWLKLDFVDRIAFGRPIPSISTCLGAHCLENRRQRGQVFVPAPEDEFFTLLLHCLLDKEEFAPGRRHRLHELCDEGIDEAYVTDLLCEVGLSREDWPRLAQSIRAQEWTILQKEHRVIETRLIRGNRIGPALRRVRDRGLRKLSLGLGLVYPRALAVAILAPDGAGKSTLAAAIGQRLPIPVRLVYMGLYQKSPTSRPSTSLPGAGFVARLLRQWRRYLGARIHLARGHFVLFDRYGFDALLDPGRVVSWPGKARRWLLAHACPAPDFVFVLDAPGEILYARKREHTIERLEAQRQDYLRLQRRLPRSAVIDATRDGDTVRREVTRLIWSTFTRRSRGRHE